MLGRCPVTQRLLLPLARLLHVQLNAASEPHVLAAQRLVWGLLPAEATS